MQRPDDKTRDKPFPWLIREALSRIERLYTDRRRFRELGPRKRTERLEAMVLVGKALLRNMDILTMRCGRPDELDRFHGIPIKTIAGWAQIAEQRAFRACWDLRDAGWLGGAQPIEKRHTGPCRRCPPGSHRGHPMIRTFKQPFFEALGLRGALKSERRRRSNDARASLTETIATRRAARRAARAAGASGRAATLAARASDQLAESKSLPPESREETIARLARDLAAWQAKNR